jgi:hypothetical protein
VEGKGRRDSISTRSREGGRWTYHISNNVLELDNDEGRERDPDANGLGEKVRSLRGEVDGHAIHDTHADRDVS